MRSAVAFLALALTGSIDVVAGSLCKPSPPSSSLIGSASTDVASTGSFSTGEASTSGASTGTASSVSASTDIASTESASTGTAATDSASTGIASTGSVSTGDASTDILSTASISDRGVETTSTGTESAYSTTETAPATTSPIKVVYNVVANGNFAAYHPNSPGGLYDWEIQNQARQVAGYGYTGDGSQETGCAELTSGAGSTPAGKKRDDTTDYNAMIEQELSDLDITTDYTVRFFYSILSNDLADTCRVEAYYGDWMFAATPYFPVVTDAVLGNTPWYDLVTSAAVETSEEFIRFTLACYNGGAADIFIDQVFVSNQVSPDDMDNISLLYSSTVSATSTASATSYTDLDATTTAQATTTGSDTTSIETGPVTPVSTTGSVSTIGSESTTGTVPTTGSESVFSTLTFSNATTGASSTDGLPTRTDSSTYSATSQSTTDDLPTTTLSSTYTSTSTPATTTSSSTTSTVSANKNCATFVSTAPAGKACGSRIYSGSSGFKSYSASDMTSAQCAALCLANPSCLSFQWNTQSSCSNTCNLIATSQGTVTQTSSDGPFVWDRSCIVETECTAQPDDTVCVNGLYNTPGSGCETSVWGTAKSCAPAFLTTSVNAICNGANQCRDLCAANPECKSYSVSYGAGVSCSLYTGTVGEVAKAGTAGVGSLFADLDCSECSGDLYYFKYIALRTTSISIPAMSCSTTTTSTTSTTTSTTTTPTTTSTTPISSSTSNTVVTYSNTTPSNATRTVNTYSGTVNTYSGVVNTYTTTPGASTTATGTSGCPAGISSPGACFAATPLPSGYLCNVLGDLTAPQATPYAVSPAKYPNQDSLSDCALICEQDSKCQAYALDMVNVMCLFSTLSLVDAGFVLDGYSTDYWSDKGCMTCLMCSTATTPVQTYTTTTTTTSTTPTTLSTSTTSGSSSASCVPLACTEKSFVSASDICTRTIIPEQDAWSVAKSSYAFQNNNAQCAAICSRLSYCKASAYDPSTSMCSFISTSLTTAGYTAGGNMQWSDQDCWNCDACGSQVTSTSSVSSSFPSSTFASNSTIPATYTAPANSSVPATYTAPANTSVPATYTAPANTSIPVTYTTSTDTSAPVTYTNSPNATASIPSTSAILTTTPFDTTSTPTTTSTTSTWMTPTESVVVPTYCSQPTAQLTDSVMCGMPGTASSQASDLLAAHYVPAAHGSLDACALICLFRADCLSFGYTPSTTYCYIYGTGTWGLGLTYVPSGSTRYFDRDCYTC